jgi:hypothetical protein
VEAGDIEVPWASIAGFADVLGLMLAACWLAARHQRKLDRIADEPAPAVVLR